MLSTYETKLKLFGTYQKELPNLRVHKSLSCRQYGNTTKEKGVLCQAAHFLGHAVYRLLPLILPIFVSSGQLTVITEMLYVPDTIY